MTGLANQLRATLYLLLHDSYCKGAFVIPVLWVVPTALIALSTQFGSLTINLDSIPALVTTGAVFGTCFAMVGLATHDLADHGLRGGCLAEGGRAGYVTSRVIVALPLAAVLALWSALLGLILLALPGATLAGVPTADVVLRALVRIPIGWAYAVIGMLLVWAARRTRGFGGVFLFTLVLTGGLLDLVVMTLVMVPAAIIQSSELFLAAGEHVRPLLMATMLAGDTPIRATTFLMPVVYAVLAGALSRRVIARAAL